MMNNDYLWEKKGSDAEIEELEVMLSGFRYEATAPPRLPVAPIVDHAQRPSWWKFSLAFAVPACLLFAVGYAFWATRGGSEYLVLNTRTEMATPSILSPEANREVIKPEIKPAEPEIPKPDSMKAIRTVFTPRTRSIEPRSIRSRHRKVHKQPLETLTSEERFAYDQLKLALSITGSKLKVVSDTVNRTED